MQKAHRLIIDIGNTRVKYYADKLFSSVDELPQNQSYKVNIIASSEPDEVIKELEAKLKIENLEIFDPQQQDYLTGVYPGLGADRVAKLIGALEKFPGSDVIVVDFGTATNMSVASKDRKFLGGFISLGLQASLQALGKNCQALDDLSDEQPLALDLAQSTQDAILAGTYSGHLAMVDEWLEAAQGLCSNDVVKICIGGDAKYFANLFDHIVEDNELLFAAMTALNEPSLA
ncbi:MAG: type III pantothenate kinase [Candidatus Melainabacteria bacterium]|nr:type III pantothenate kinase [Candidatus Melainabacteria bacterium]